MKKYCALFMLLLSCSLFAHTVDYGKVILRHWCVVKEDKYVDGSFYMYKGGDVYIETGANQIVHYPLSSFSNEDQTYALMRHRKIAEINYRLTHPVAAKTEASQYYVSYFKLLLAVSIVLLLGLFIYKTVKPQQLKYLYPVLFTGVLTLILGFSTNLTKSLRSISTSPSYIDSAFTPYKPNVITSWDSTYFYVGSYGFPSHELMAGITAWNQQVPIPQCYIGNNAWSIPLNPVIADTPIAVNQINFTRGAIALAVNGVPIFNEFTNTGADAYLTGQLDSFGGHAGRGDDYHYHIAPMFLQNQGSVILPIAFAFDGFAIYGSLEPDGNPMMPLDTNHGHYWTNGVYHYHGTNTAPYMIKNFVGQVTEDTTHQLIPQAAAHPVRPGQTPLPPLLITKTHCNDSSSYTLVYVLNGATDSIVYSWTPQGVYTYHFFIQDSAETTQTYNGFVPCYSIPCYSTPTSVNEVKSPILKLNVYPNPMGEDFYLVLGDNSKLSEIKSVTVYSLTGNIIYQSKGYGGKINLSSAAAGTYLVKVGFDDFQLCQKLVVK
jgi:YHYH protein/Secretion system C-terminal sorting domain